MSDVAVSIKNVSKHFRLPHERFTGLKQAIINFRPGRKFERQDVLKDISFDIKKGEFFAIVGRNGSGKSTLLKLIAQIYAPNSGSIQVNGQLTPFIELGVGFNPELTGRENIYLNGALLGMDHKQVDAIYGDIVEFAELDRFMDQKLKNYSSGMQVRLAFSIAIRANTDILLVDEVLAVGDAAFQQKCFNYFEELRRNKRTVVFVSHDMAAVQRFCTAAVYLDNGRLIRQGSPSEIADVYAEENLASAQAAADAGPKLSGDYSVGVQIIDDTDAGLHLEFDYRSNDDTEMYVGISILKNGISIAEISTIDHMTVRGNGTLKYFLETKHFNSGVYELTVAMFRQANRELIAIGGKKQRFSVRGYDITKGGAVKLADTWKRD